MLRQLRISKDDFKNIKDSKTELNFIKADKKHEIK